MSKLVMRRRVIFPMLLLGCALTTQLKADDFIRINGEDVSTVVSKDEFLRVYKKNHTIQNHKSLNEYLELYTNFLLKVTEAKALGMDTIPDFLSEFATYRAQLAAPYLRDDVYRDTLIRELFTMMQEDRRVSHIMLRVDFDQALPEDTLHTYRNLVNIKQEIASGDISFSEAAVRYSKDRQSGEAGGDLGWFNLFKYPYPFEKAAHALDIGEVSDPIRTRFGYHLLAVTDIRDAVGEIKVAHIIKVIPQGANYEQQDSIQNLVHSIYEELKQGEEFSKLAANYSDDHRSGNAGGELPWFGAGQMIGAFENAAFELAQNGDISKPVQSVFGWHIIKRIDRKNPKTFDEVKQDIETKLSGREFSVLLKKAFIEHLKETYLYAEKRKNLTAFYSLDESVFTKEEKISASFVQASLNDTLFVFSDTAVYVRDYLDYLNNVTHLFAQLKVPPRNYIDRMFVRYVDETLLAYEDQQLHHKYDAFRHLVNEYYEGILLFNIMDKKVWTKAVNDSAGLADFYHEHRNDYLWDERMLTTVYRFTDPKEARYFQRQLSRSLNRGQTVEDALSRFENNYAKGHSMVQKEVKYSQREDELISAMAWEPGVSAVVEKDRHYFVLHAVDLIDPAPKELREVKGLVVSQYQDYLEKRWLKQLRKKYTIEIDRSALSSLIDDL